MTPSQELQGDPTTMVFAVPLAGTTVRRAIPRSTPMDPVRQRSHSSENLPRWTRWSPRTSESEVPFCFFGKSHLKQTTNCFPLPFLCLWTVGRREHDCSQKVKKWWNESTTRKQNLTDSLWTSLFWRLQISPSKKNPSSSKWHEHSGWCSPT